MCIKKGKKIIQRRLLTEREREKEANIEHNTVLGDGRKKIKNRVRKKEQKLKDERESEKKNRSTVAQMAAC